VREGDVSHDQVIRQNVLEHLKWSSSVKATHIGIAVREGIVELSDHVESRPNASRCLSRVLRVLHKRSASSAERAARLMSWDVRLPNEAIKVKVEQGWVTLCGQVGSWSEREIVLSDMEKLSGMNPCNEFDRHEAGGYIKQRQGQD
jgi:osmotically-inducible protein OsmY